MKPLREESAADASLAHGLDILRSTPATAPMAEARRRVWAAVEYEAARARARAAMRPLQFRPLALVAALVLLGGTAGAVIGHRRVGALLDRLVTPARPDNTGSSSGPPPRPHPRRTASRDATPYWIPPAPGAEAAAPPVIAPGAERRRTRARGTVIADAALAAPTGAARDGQVLDAMVALRRDHDAARAQDLLARYLASQPRGALREEAMVLSIEAANARGDQPRVDNLVKQYRASYPAGRFRSFVEELSKGH